ncbi:MAG: nucleoside triphosphate pyrophosphohydrolase [Kiritimatiellia bacterium]
MTGSASGKTSGIDRLLEVVRRLRAPGGCPWDREQTLDSLKKYMIEEGYEVIDAIDSDDVREHMEELGDVLLHVVLQSQIRTEEGEFTFEEVAQGISNKLVRRHPHVFGDAKADDSAHVLRRWDDIKAAEKGGKRSAVDGVPRHLPALQKAQRVQSRASRVGFDWTGIEDVAAKVEEELEEVRESLDREDRAATAEELGDLLFAVVNLCRFRGLSAEEVLDKTVGKFMARFRKVEERIRSENREIADCDLKDLDAHWEKVKEEEGKTESRKLKWGKGDTANRAPVRRRSRQA